MDIKTHAGSIHQLQSCEDLQNWVDNGSTFTAHDSTTVTKSVCTADISQSFYRVSAKPAFYVSPSGKDTNNGLVNSPWKTIQFALDRAVAGNTIFVKTGVYNEKIRFTKSGNATDGYIVLENYQNDTPVIDGSGLDVDETLQGLVTIKNAGYIRIRGFELRNFRNGRAGYVPAGIYVEGTAHHIEIRNCFIHHIETNYALSDPNGFGIAVYGTHGQSPVNSVIIDSNEISNCKLGSSETISLNGNVVFFQITNNRVHHNDNIGIDAIGYEQTSPDESTDRARNGIISDNRVYAINTTGNPAYTDRSADGIYVDGGKDVVIERNIVYDCDIGIEIACEHTGRFTENIIVRNNFIYGNYTAGISVGGYDSLRGGTINCMILHNSLYNNDTGQDGTGEVSIQYHVDSCEVKNNILYAVHGYYIVSEQPVTNTSIDYNLYYADDATSWVWSGTEYTSLSAWKNATEFDVHSLHTDPLLRDKSTGDLHIQPASPAKDTGITHSYGGEYDIDTTPRINGVKPEIGADEI